MSIVSRVSWTKTVLCILLLTVMAAPMVLRAETGADAWLRYPAIDDVRVRQQFDGMPAVVVAFGDSEIIGAARSELMKGVDGMLGRILRVEGSVPREGAIVLGTLDALRREAPALAPPGDIGEDGFRLRTVIVDGHRNLVIAGANDRGVLYGAFALLRKIGLYQDVLHLDETEVPYSRVRWVNEWDNLDGSIERGYAGRSIFFDGDNVREDLTRVSEYGRLLASLGISACTVNNVNANPRVITPEFLPQLERLAAAFRPWGVRLAVSVDFSSPKLIGGLDTFDPLDPAVAKFWQDTIDRTYAAIPDFGGIVLKADSEGRVGPSAYNRSHADAANVIARPLAPHGGLLFYRGFVYDHHMDWRDLKNDRARAAYDNFKPLDGDFDDNVLIQIKNGPIDFQVREPASPLFGALEKTNQAIELQITQEYFGQARHMVFLVPMWEETLNFDMQAKGAGTPVKALVAGKVFNRPTGGFVGVSNVGLDVNWTHHPISQANLYGFGRLAWNPNLSSRQIAEEWTELTYNHDPHVVETIVGMMMRSWETFEDYTGTLGTQTLTAIAGNHYGPAVESSERNGWGQWHRADEKGIGMDRTVATGTGFAGQYSAPVAKMYESLDTCPDELILWFHHLPYTYVLHSGKTIIQHIYDVHYQGAADVQSWVEEWRSLHGRIDNDRYYQVLAMLEYQAGHAQVWRDSINNWFLGTSGIADAQGRAGHFPNRTEAEAMTLTGYEPVEVKPWETASGKTAIVCGSASGECTASFKYNGDAGWRTLDVQYFDQINGVSTYQVYVAGQLVDQWKANNDIPTRTPDGHSSTRRRIRQVALRPGDEIRIVGQSDEGEKAPLDYAEILAAMP